MSSAQTVIAPLRKRQVPLFLWGLALLWPAVVFGDVFGFNDTVSYLRGADTLAAKVIGHGSDFFAPPTSLGGATAQPPAERMVLYGRSLYFGLFLYLGLLARSFWLIAVIQALAAGAVLVGVVRHFVDPARERAFRSACLVTFAMAACTPLPFFVCFLMPDLAVGLALPAAAVLLCRWRAERKAWRWGWLALLGFAALSHSTAVALFALLALGGFMAAGIKRSRTTLMASLAMLVLALVGVAGEAAFGLASRLTTGLDPVRPPFLTARLIESGPARRFLAERCQGADFVLCRYPVTEPVSAEVFLWEPTRPRGGFKALPVADAVQVSHEQVRFALAVAQAYPGETARALASDFVRLASNLRLHDFRPEYVAGRMGADRPFAAMAPGVPLPAIDRLVSAVTALLLIASLIALPFVWRRAAGDGRARMVWTLLAAIVLNDMICAWLSGPFARYNTRVVWALPVLVALFFVGRQSRPSATTSRER